MHPLHRRLLHALLVAALRHPDASLQSALVSGKERKACRTPDVCRANSLVHTACMSPLFCVGNRERQQEGVDMARSSPTSHAHALRTADDHTRNLTARRAWHKSHESSRISLTAHLFTFPTPKAHNNRSTTSTLTLFPCDALLPCAVQQRPFPAAATTLPSSFPCPHASTSACMHHMRVPAQNPPQAAQRRTTSLSRRRRCACMKRFSASMWSARAE